MNKDVSMTHILVTNDDGVNAPGLLALVQAIQPLGKISVLAPDHNWSASGHVKTLHRPLRVKDTLLADGTPAKASDGAPSDCVALAMMGILPEKVDLVVSGINPNANLGNDLTYSGTVTAAMEAAIWGLPAMAVSLDSPENLIGPLDFTAAASAAREVAQRILENGLPQHTLLNVNLPYLPENEIKGFCITRLGLRIYRDVLVRREDPRGRPYYWIGGDAPTGVPENDTDIGALAQGYISVTPIQLDMTAYQLLNQVNGWSWQWKQGQE
jgi:5'-nucleotidase